jgi:tetratricopeptide (TPR) repeat protein
VGNLTYEHLAISAGLRFMFQIYQACYRFCRFSRVALFSSSYALLLLVVPTITEFPGSKLLAQTAPTQDLDAASFFQQGVTRYNRNDYQAAESAFREALQRDSNLGAARNYLGNIMLQQNRLDAAVQEYGEAIRINPNLGDAYYNLGLALHKQGQKEAAITSYRKALVVEPTMANAQYNLGVLLYEQGQFPEAIAAYEQAINLDSSNANAYFNLAIAQHQQGKIADAIAAYRQAVQLNPKNAVAYYNLGVILYNQGELKEANAVLKSAGLQYREEGNTEQVDKVKQLMQQIAQGQSSSPQASGGSTPTPTNNVVQEPVPQMPTQSETPPEAQANPADVPTQSETPPGTTINFGN